MCSQFIVNGGLLDDLTGVRDYRATSGVGNYIGCYGSEDDWADQLWEVKCRGTRQEDVFICKSPSMGEAGKTVKNDPYNAALWQGCDEVMEAETSCKQLEEKRMAGECSLHSEVVDGVFTFREGASTGLQPAMSCKNMSGQNRNITVCEPFWRKERVYRCTGEKVDWANIKERAKYIGSNISYDESTATWNNQGDLTWDDDGTKVTKVFDPSLAFMKNGASCNRDTVRQSVRECVENKSGRYECPALEGETIASGCECFDREAFGQVVSSLAAVDMASKNMICSTGQEVGVCTVEDIGGTAEVQVVCGNFSIGPDGTLQAVSEDDLKPCEPKLWRGAEVADQTHVVTISDKYRCLVSAPALPEDDHFDNDLGSLIPLSSWFDSGVLAAMDFITASLRSDPGMIPDPETGCDCAGADCAWISHTDDGEVKRENALTLKADTAEPFGAVYLSLVQTGFWEGTREGKAFQCGHPHP